jgi:rare lipoprotein A (peptidoglycan hydrolase)
VARAMVTAAMLACLAHRAPPPTEATHASWYGTRPAACYDATGRHSVPPGKLWTANRSLPCGTLVTVTGPAGSAVVAVEDRGPYGVAGRDLDLSPAAFRAVAGPLSRGVAPVTYRAAA